MTLAELRDYVILKVTAGGKRELNITPADVEALATAAFEMALPWFTEPVLETFALSSRVILLADLTYPTTEVINVYPTESLLSTQSLDYELTGVRVLSMDEHAYWEWLHFRPQLEAIAERLDAVVTVDKILLSGIDNLSGVTVEYARTITDIADITNKRVVEWIRDMALAQTQETIGHLRSKFRGAPLQFELDGADLVSAAQTKIEALKAELPNLHMYMKVER